MLKGEAQTVTKAITCAEIVKRKMPVSCVSYWLHVVTDEIGLSIVDSAPGYKGQILQTGGDVVAKGRETWPRDVRVRACAVLID